MANFPLQLDSRAIAKIRKMFAWISLLLGIFILSVGGLWVHHNHMDGFLLYTGKAEGEVVENKPEFVPGNSTTNSLSYTAYKAVVEYTDSSGYAHSFNDHMGFSVPSFSVGQKVVVWYDEQDTGKAQIDRGIKNYIIPAIIGVFGGLILLSGVRQVLSLTRGKLDYDPAASTTLKEK